MPGVERGEVQQFGVFEVSLRAHELRKHGVRIRLNGQPFDLLRLFLERPGEVVSREEMRACLWPDDTFVDFERSLNSAVKKLRSVLGDSPDRPLYIETIPRVGYRFVAPVSRVAPEASQPKPAGAPPVVPLAQAKRAAASRPWVWIAASLTLLVLCAVAWFVSERHAGVVLAATDRVVLADLLNTTGDAAFDSSLGQALRVGLSESPFLNLVPDADVRRAQKGAVSGEIARRLCMSMGAAAVIEGTVSRSDGLYEIGLVASRCAGGAIIARVRQRAGTREQVLDALGQAGAELRVRLGEPETVVEKFRTPVGQATSTSLAALKSFALGEEKRARGQDYEAIPDYKLAADLDPAFALAYARLGAIYQNAQEWAIGRQYNERAFAAREHTSEHERLYITAHYYSIVTNEIDKQLQVYELWRQVYPRDIVAPNNLSSIYLRAGKTDQALAAAREAVRLGPDNAFCRLNLARALQRTGNYAEARVEYSRLVARKMDGMNLHLARYYMAFGESDQAEMDAQLNWAKGNSREGEMLDAAAWGAAALGQMAKARALFHKASQIGEQGGLQEYAALVLLDDAQIETDVGYTAEAARDVDEALRLAGDSTMVQGYSAMVLARMGSVTRALALADKASKSAPLDTLLQNVTLATARALAAMHQKQPDEALQQLDRARPYDFGTDSNLITIYYRGEAFLDAGRYTEATGEFRRLLNGRLVNPNSPYLALAQLGLARAAVRAGDRTAAQSEFEAFLAGWKGADSGLPVVRAALAEGLGSRRSPRRHVL